MVDGLVDVWRCARQRFYASRGNALSVFGFFRGGSEGYVGGHLGLKFWESDLRVGGS